MRLTPKRIEAILFAFAGLFAWIGFGFDRTAPGGYQPGPRDPAALRVVTWNVGGKNAQPLQDAWIPDIAETLARLDADLIFLQEVTGADQLERLRQTARDANPKCQLFGTMNAGSGTRLAVLFQRGHLRAWPIAVGSSRSALAVGFHPDDHPPVAAVALHADAFSSVKRNRGIGRAVDLLLSYHFADARLLVGDLNLDLDLDKRRDLFSDNEHRDVESYNYIAVRLFDAAAGTGATADPDRRLDYIFINDRFTVINAGPWKRRRTASMDHDPLVADLRFITP